MWNWCRLRWRAPVVAAVVAVGALSGCAPEDFPDDGKPIVVTTFTVLADIASVVAGDRIHVRSITKPGAEIHGYEPTPGDMRRSAKADLIVDNGLNLESWFSQFVEPLDVEHVVISDGVKPIDITSDAYAGKPNPHAWMSPLNVEIYVDNLVRAFTGIDPGGAVAFQANAVAYKKQLRQVHDDLVAALRTVPEKQRALVTCEGAFPYLTRDAGIAEHYIWPVNAEQQATPKQVSETIDYVRDNDVPAVFCESTVSDRPMKQVAAATGARFGGTLYVDSLSDADGPVPTYLDLIRHDAKTIVSGLTGR
ncbi:metal ABC transporter substrate-binding protein [Gordonia sp. (in: high G+C Gram-positive bacteria)]|mgnify:CR=1 FL=1|uniref:metal ABC transporter substrate-binding protein n=1 Tax=Gordonia sp. (in: high G+C Gram-positive bacteria) TaxID=84139 RepID=UPI001DC6437E|nr:metal ABC transporter substrate-binding protein [Gordonia sp. (in: high G+C Gram-positive bacteria)]MCB1296160.1 metal ABC transporter substrate-binding protein [Gordonia sp. (in: high G+C Gram-positive bacteria)]HMS76807.1 metal ABC transporter substrate-binding protein [Gordonia sp. (in: high G+C Gram-positive bacteria)]HQV21132.1 metal ABC transporter substrate-binding protein [Gordonia sp. (in: high G+C Gram-positive bacteria)]